MKLTDTTKSVLAARRERREMEKAGYERINGPWEIERGWRWDHVIVDAKIAAGGKGVWVKCEKEPSP